MRRAGWGIALLLGACGGGGSGRIAFDASSPDARRSVIDAGVPPTDAARLDAARLVDAAPVDADLRPDAWIDAALAPPIPELPDAGPPGSCAPGIDAGPPQDARLPAELIAPCCDDGDGGLVLPARITGTAGFILSGPPDSNGDAAMWRYDGRDFASLGNKVRWEQADGTPGAWVDQYGGEGAVVDDGVGLSFYEYDELVSTDVARVAHDFEGSIFLKTDGTLWDHVGPNLLQIASDPDSFDEIVHEGWPVWMTDWDGSEGWLHIGDLLESGQWVIRASRYDTRGFVWWDHWDADDPMPNGTLWAGLSPTRLAFHALPAIAMDPDDVFPQVIAFWTVEHLADGEHLVIDIEGSRSWDLGVTARPVALRVNGSFATFEIDDGGTQLFAGTDPPVKLGHRGVVDWAVAGDHVGILYPGGLLTTVPSTGGAETIVTTDAAGPMVAVNAEPGYLAYVARNGALHQVAFGPCTDVVISPTTSADPPLVWEQSGWGEESIAWKTASNELLARDPSSGVTVDIAPEVDRFLVPVRTDSRVGYGVYFDGTSEGPGFYVHRP